MVVCSGAGMGADSGLGTFRGVNAGIWPPLAKKNICFTDISNPRSSIYIFHFFWGVGREAVNVKNERIKKIFFNSALFETRKPLKDKIISIGDKFFSHVQFRIQLIGRALKSDPYFIYGLWQWRYEAYTSQKPHRGYAILDKWGEKVFLIEFFIFKKLCKSFQKRGGYAIFTSNIDGHHIASLAVSNLVRTPISRKSPLKFTQLPTGVLNITKTQYFTGNDKAFSGCQRLRSMVASITCSVSTPTRI